MSDSMVREKGFSFLFGQLEQRLNGQKSRQMHLIRKKALDYLYEVSFPSRKDENWKYTGVKQIVELDFQEPSLSVGKVDEGEIKGAETLQIVNGKLMNPFKGVLDLGNGVQLFKIDEALEDGTFATTIQQFIDVILEEKQAFSLLNLAFSKNGLFLYVPKNAQATKLLHIQHITEECGVSFMVPTQIFGLVEQGGNASIIESFHHVGEENSSYFINGLNRFEIKANASLTHYKLQKESSKAYQVTNSGITQERDSIFTSHVIDAGGRMVRNNLNTELKGSGTETNYYGVYYATGDSHIDNQTFIDHAVPHCESNELYKGILDDHGVGVFNGKVLVRQDAQKTNAYQQNSSLVLSQTATMNAKPQLEIFADDVRCSHGATIGQLDEQSVFYLKSRGVPEPDARKLLQNAFLGEVIEKIENEVIKDYAESLIQ
jgi:Fe-S cluster assembly protein SufD